MLYRLHVIWGDGVLVSGANNDEKRSDWMGQKLTLRPLEQGVVSVVCSSVSGGVGSLTSAAVAADISLNLY